MLKTFFREPLLHHLIENVESKNVPLGPKMEGLVLSLLDLQVSISITGTIIEYTRSFSKSQSRIAGLSIGRS